MEITMTLTVTPEQAAKIISLLEDSKPMKLPAPADVPQLLTVPNPTVAPVTNFEPAQRQDSLPTAIPTQVRTYSVNDLAIACRPLMEAGKLPELQALLAEFGASAGLASVPENRRAEFAGRLRQMGGQI